MSSRLPNGFGSVTKLSGKRRNPWRARATAGWGLVDNGKVKQLYVNLGCYEKKIQGIQALTAYHNDPDIFVGLLDMYKKGHITLDDLFALRLPKTSPEKIIKNVEKIGTTLEQIYKLWLEDKGKYGCASKSDERKYQHRLAWESCGPISHMLVSDITLSVMQSLIDNTEKSKNSLKGVKQLLNAIFEYSIIKNIISKSDNMTKYIDLSQAAEPNKRPSKRFTSTDMEVVWQAIKDTETVNIYVYVVLILIYTGLRISELLDLKKKDVFFDKRYLSIIDSKTPSGIRLVPIAEKIVPFIEFWLNRNESEYLITSQRGRHMNKNQFARDYWNPLMSNLGIKYTAHNARKTCSSLLTTQRVDERWIKKIIGHKAQDLTEDVYTEIEIEPLIEAINLI